MSVKLLSLEAHLELGELGAGTVELTDQLTGPLCQSSALDNGDQVVSSDATERHIELWRHLEVKT